MAAAQAERRGPHDAHAGHGDMVADFRRRFWICLALTVPILALSPPIQSFIGLEQRLAFAGDSYILFAVSSAVFFYGGWPFLNGLAHEIGKRAPGMMTLIALAISVAYFYSAAVTFGLQGEVFFWETATLIDIMLLGHWIEMKSILGASRALEMLVRLLPATAHRLLERDAIEDVPLDRLQPGDRVLVKPGERVPVDGVIRSGRSTLDESMLTGESKPVERAAGARVIGGAINGEGALTIEIDRVGEATYLAQVINLVKQAQQSRSRTQDLANRAALWLTYIAIGVGSATFAIWFGLGESTTFALERMVTVMVISCPHALGLAVPLVVAVSTSLSAGNGLLIRDRAAFERARNLQAVVFDKTGTLTQGRFGVTEVITLADLSADEVLALAAALESASEHPIAKGITRAAQEKGLAVRHVEDFQNVTGQGATGSVDGRSIAIVGPNYLRLNAVHVANALIDNTAAQGKTVVYVLDGARPVGAIALADIVRPESRAAIDRLKSLGLRCMMLTGDAKPVADSVARELGLDEVFAEVLPHEKAEKIRQVQARGISVSMVGDGVNDAPALTQSDLGIAIGAGTDIAIEAADVVLVRNDPRDVAAILALSRATYSKMVQNLLWATGYNAIAIPLAAGVAAPWGIMLSPAIGAAFMSISTVIVAVNAKLLRNPANAG